MIGQALILLSCTGNMARRRKEDDLVEIGVRLVGLVLMIGIVLPQGRQLLAAFGILAFGVIVVGLVAFVIYRLATKSKGQQVASTLAYTAGHAISPGYNATRPDLDIDLHGSAARCTPLSHKQPGHQELIQRLRSIDWFQFEKVIALAYRKHGYSVSRRGGANPDGGIDLLIRKDGETQAVQCKQWKTWKVGVKIVREFLGALTDAQIKRGIIITLCGCSDDARAFAIKHGIEILDETAVAGLLEKVDARFDPKLLGLLEDTRKYCPRCEREMVLRTAGKGTGVGRQFWGCSAYPRCRFTLQAAA